MDKKAEKRYLVGYNGDERYRIYSPEKNKVILSRDVRLKGKFSGCQSSVDLPFQDSDTKDIVEDEKKEKDLSSHKARTKTLLRMITSKEIRSGQKVRAITRLEEKRALMKKTTQEEYSQRG